MRFFSFLTLFCSKRVILGQKYFRECIRRVDLNFLTEALMGEIMKVLRVEMEQVHEWIDWVENAHVEQPQNAPKVHRRQRVQPRKVRVEDE